MQQRPEHLDFIQFLLYEKPAVALHFTGKFNNKKQQTDLTNERVQ